MVKSIYLRSNFNLHKLRCTTLPAVSNSVSKLFEFHDNGQLRTYMRFTRLACRTLIPGISFQRFKSFFYDSGIFNPTVFL